MKLPKVGKPKKSQLSAPTENYRSENAITQHFAEKNTGVYATFGKLNIFSHGILQIMVNVP